ncbi:MAG: cob(I)yrinic acid a,c-diamide adenosyltransferase [Deltaproteobacteria bacterium]|nr:cob(I)yrinic acid a,c-diamide adenosyltransferase [Deltaproteobacteria bacterium]
MAFKFSKKGDRGYTSLLGGQRVLKSGPRPEAYGTLDEASSALGIARATAKGVKTREALLGIQKDLLVLGTELSTAEEDPAKFPSRITGDHVDHLEQVIDDLQQGVQLKPEFILPGETLASAAIDLGRTIIRRAERRTVRLMQGKMIENPEVLRYLNRLADLLFTLARYEENQEKP